MTIALLVAVSFVGVLLQTLSGFGFALMAMPVLTLALGLKTAGPLVALAGLTVYTIHLVRLHQAINRSEVLRLALAAALGVPVGIWGMARLDEWTVKAVLGGIMVAYAVYALINPTPSHPCARWWAYPAGFLSGCLGGAYNTPGPPVVVYGSLRLWPKDEYRASLQTLYFLSAVLVVSSHLIARHVTPDILRLYAWALPALLLGILAGARLDHKIDHRRFRLLVAVMILGLGLSLLLGTVPR